MVDEHTQIENPPFTARTARYPGVQPFGDDDIQRHLFRGRDAEKYELLQLVLVERLVLLFARSGVGKSSLINAGLLEPLRSKRYFPLVARVSGAKDDPLENLYDGIKVAVAAGSERAETEFEPADEAAWNKTSLWHFFKTFEIWRGNKLMSPVLVLDQFEELFTLFSKAQRRQLINELADVVRGTRPKERRGEDDTRVSDAPPQVKVVLALREDFYANLEELRERIPTIYKTALRLNPLTREQARTAIAEPAALEGEDYSTPAFTWSDEALTMILDFLTEQQLGDGKTTLGDEVEPFQLQLICQHFETVVRDQQLSKVTEPDLGGKDALKLILSDFYESSLQKICEKFKEEKDLRKKLEHLCEYGFITAQGRRLLREESTIKQEDDIPPEILREMVELRLLRKEPRVGDNYYELTHDTLIEPIQLSRKEREKREADAEARARKKRNRRLGYGATAVLCIAVVVSVWFWFQAKQQKKLAIAEVQKAKQEAETEVKEVKQEAEKKTAKAKVEVVEARVKELEQTIAKYEAEEKEAQAKLSVLEKDALKAKEQQRLADTATTGAAAEKSQQKSRLQGILDGIFEDVKKEQQRKKFAVDEQRAAREQLMQVKSKSAQLKTELQESQVKSLKLKAESTQKEIEEAEQSRINSAGTDLAQVAETQVNKKKGELAAIEIQVKEELTKVDEAKSEQRSVEDQIDKVDGAEEVVQPAGINFDELSICEKFDVLRDDNPEVAASYSLDLKQKVDRLAELDAMLERSAVVVTKENLVISPKKSDNPEQKETFRKSDKEVYIYIWFSTPSTPKKPQTFRIEYLDGRGKVLSEKKDKLSAPNRLQGKRLGFRYWTWIGAGAQASGKRRIKVSNSDNDVLCQREFEVEN